MRPSIVSVMLAIGVSVFGWNQVVFAGQQTTRTGPNGKTQTTVRTVGNGQQTTTRTGPKGRTQTTTRTVNP